jgi:hypothetical protein
MTKNQLHYGPTLLGASLQTTWKQLLNLFLNFAKKTSSMATPLFLVELHQLLSFGSTSGAEVDLELSGPGTMARIA